MRTVMIEVTDEDIAKGDTMSCMTCPIALAAARVFGGEVSVTFSHIVAWTPDVSAFTPRAAKQFISDFDCRRPVSPITFTIEVPR